MQDDDRPLFERPLEELLPPLPPRERFDTSGYRDGSGRSSEELVAIARLQKRLVVVFLSVVAAGFALGILLFLLAASGVEESVTTPLAFGGYLLVILPLQLTMFVIWLLLAIKLFQPVTVVLLVVLIFPCGLGVVSLIITVVRSTTVLREHGIRVGLLGAKKSDLPKVN